MVSPLFLLLCSILPFSLAATLYNGSQAQHYPTATSECLAAFNTTISCDDTLVQLLPFSLTTVGWNTSLLSILCTTDCGPSLDTLATAVQGSCGDDTFPFNGGNMTYTQVVDLYQFKYGLVCLKDSSTGDFCIDVENSWDISSLESQGTATWPVYTNKTYPNCLNEGWESDGDVPDGNPYVGTDYVYPTDLPQTPIDYVAGATNGSSPDLSYGWAEILEYDEHPLEIQCSPCFLDRLKYGVASIWGEVYDEITVQVWDNIQRNCNITDELSPARNMSGVGYNATIPDMLPYPNCPQNITINWQIGNNYTTCNKASLQYSIPAASLRHMNTAINCAALSGTFCAPDSCNVTRVTETTTLKEFIENYDNVTMTQMTAWNPHIQTFHLEQEEIICIGPPGGVFIPTTTGVASPSVYTTTDSPTQPTPSGTSKSCGLYYEVVAGDYCDLVTLKFSLTFSQFVGLNPSIDSACSNLELGYDYCVAPVNGTAIPVPTTTLAPSNTVSGGSSSSIQSSTSTRMTTPKSTTATPIKTVSGTSSIATTSHIVSASSISATNPSQTISPDGTCGGSNGYLCKGSSFGDCCSEYGSCGSSSDFCGSGCQPAYGSCDGSATISPDGTCGGTSGYTCAGSSFGDCCSEYGYCGSTSDFCSTGCQDDYGSCSS